ncbi:DUF262 domain-containing protein [Pectobacterium brasiliense]|uniref:DUF262 domain-containing protein n=1 Tax=Pectobacterium brasiliense TaxID=180957 RepID=UPI0032EEB3FA
MNIIKIKEELDKNRMTVSFDSYDIAIRQMIDMVIEESINISPEYQRHFVWDEVRQSQLIESIFLGIPVPNLFMATNEDASWDVVDGVQRITTILNFMCQEEQLTGILKKFKKLKLTGMEKLTQMNGLYFDDLPNNLKLMFSTRSIRLTVLNDKSDFNVRYDLFERLNTGGVVLHPQQIRNCVFIGEFNDFINRLSQDLNFRKVVKTTENAERNGSFEEIALKFFAYLEYVEKFDHGVKDFLNEYMKFKTNSFKNKKELESNFKETFELLARLIPSGIVRGNRKNITPIVLYEAISVGTCNAMKVDKNKITTAKLSSLLNDEKLKKLTTGGTNDKNKVFSRIKYVKDYLLA